MKRRKRMVRTTRTTMITRTAIRTTPTRIASVTTDTHLDVSTASKPSVSTVGSRQSTGDIERVQSAKTTTVEEADIQTMHDTESVLSCPDKS